MAKITNIVVPPSLEEDQRKIIRYPEKGLTLSGSAFIKNSVFTAKKPKKQTVIKQESAEAAHQIVSRWFVHLSEKEKKSKIGEIKREIRAGVFNPIYFDIAPAIEYVNDEHLVQCSAYVGPDPTNNQNPPITRQNCTVFRPQYYYDMRPTFSEQPYPSLGWLGSSANGVWSDEETISLRCEFRSMILPSKKEKQHLFFRIDLQTRVNASFSPLSSWPRPAFFYNQQPTLSRLSNSYPKIRQYRPIPHQRRYLPPNPAPNVQWDQSETFVLSWNSVPRGKQISLSQGAVMHVCHYPPAGRYFGANNFAKVRSIASATLYLLK